MATTRWHAFLVGPHLTKKLNKLSNTKEDSNELKFMCLGASAMRVTMGTPNGSMAVGLGKVMEVSTHRDLHGLCEDEMRSGEVVRAPSMQT